MSEKIVTNAPRKTRRDIKNPLSGDFNKYLTEIVLNADDSYKRIESRTDDASTKEIIIDLDRKRREVTVIDYAEGMTAEEMETKFGVYGADHARGTEHETVRGIFGQGASDVLFSCAMSEKKAEIKSIRENRLHTCKFYFKEERVIRAQTQKRATAKPFKAKHGIDENGTVVTFGIPEEVSIPRKKDIRQRLETFYMFRYILADPRRKVILIDDGKRAVLSSKKHMFSRMKPVLSDKEFSFDFEGRTITGTIRLYLNKNKENDGTHVIIKDEREAVYDNTLFELEKYPGAHLISGECVIEGLYHILKEKLEDEKNPLMILTDSRDGFDRRNNFTKRFSESVSPIVKSTIIRVNRQYQHESVSLDRNRRYKDVLRKINDFYKERIAAEIGALSPGLEPPAGGLAFAREAISVTEGKRYVLHLYVNMNLLEPGTAITLEYPDTAAFSVHPPMVTAESEEADENGLLSRSVMIEAHFPTDEPATLRAVSGDHEATVDIRVVKEEVLYPRYGLEFIPKHYHFAFNRTAHLKLYYDTQKYPPGTVVNLTYSSQQELFDREESHELTAGDWLYETTGCLKIPFKSGNRPIHYTVTASTDDYRTKARIKVEQKQEKDKGKRGFLNNIELIFEDSFWQTSLDTASGTLFINGDHPINRAIMGDLHKLDRKSPAFSENQHRYILELIAQESAKHMAENNFSKRSIDSVVDVADFIQSEKTALYRHLQEDR